MFSIDFMRGILAGLLFLIGLVLWNDWQAAHPTQAPTPTVIPNIASPTPSPVATAAVSNITATKHAKKMAPITVTTDVLQLKINPQGGSLTSAELLKYPRSLEDQKPFVLLNDQSDTFYTAQSGLTSPQGPDNETTTALYQAPKSSYTLAPGEDTLIVPLTWKNAQGLMVQKTYTFTRGSYATNVSFDIHNNTHQAWQGQFYAQLKRSDTTLQQHHSFMQMNPFMGAVLSSPDKRYQKFTFKELAKEPLAQNIQNGWMAMEQHYFLGAWIPAQGQTFQYSSQATDNDQLFSINMVGPTLNVAPGEHASTQATLYIGPTIAKTLAAIAPGLDLTLDYGWLWFIGKILFWLLDHIHSVVANWGWSIVLLTLFVKLCFYQLSATSYKSMAAMRKLQPQLQQIRERYGDDRQKVAQLTMELYRKEKVNPMGGCLPLLVQIPVFIALYWVLLASVQLRLAPFILWIHDLSAPDPYYILPILMGISMFLQQKMAPTPPDPMQAKIMMAMPVMFTFFFLNFPSGLVLYWVVSNILSIAQQWFITKRYEKKEASRAKKKK